MVVLLLFLGVLGGFYLGCFANTTKCPPTIVDEDDEGNVNLLYTSPHSLKTYELNFNINDCDDSK